MPAVNRRHLDQLVTRPGPFTDPDVEFGDVTIEHLEKIKVLSVTGSI